MMDLATGARNRVPIAQLVFHRTVGDATYSGHYSCAIGPEFPKFDGLMKAASLWRQLGDSE